MKLASPVVGSRFEVGREYLELGVYRFFPLNGLDLLRYKWREEIEHTKVYGLCCAPGSKGGESDFFFFFFFNR